MYSFRPVLSLCTVLGGCTEPPECTLEFRIFTAAVVDSTGQPLSGVTVTDTVPRTGAVLDVTGSLASLHFDGVPIFCDGFQQEIAPAGDDVIVVATAGGRSGRANYRFGADGCHVRKLAGPDTVVVP
jgi:hypothetical protein